MLQKEIISIQENNKRRDSNIEGKHKDTHGSEEEDIHSEIESQKVVRLECTVAVLEAEVSHLSATISLLENNTIKLEQENGKLLAETITVWYIFAYNNLFDIQLKKKIRYLDKSCIYVSWIFVTQNAALQSQVMQLQEDIEKDAKLRKELVDRLERAKVDLNQELTNLDQSLKVIILNNRFVNFLIRSIFIKFDILNNA